MTTFLEDALAAADAEEGLDVLDALPDIVAGGAPGAAPRVAGGMAPPPRSAAEWLRRAAAGEGATTAPAAAAGNA
jgi:hypothetical protein